MGKNDRAVTNRHASLSTMSPTEIDEMLAVLAKQDPKLKSVIKWVNGFPFKYKNVDSPFNAIVEAIIYQQLHGKAAATIYGRVKALFKSDSCPTPKQFLSTPDTVLRSAGLSHSKIAALKDLSERSLQGLIPTIDDVATMTDDEIIAALSAVKGVGPWTAQMFLMFSLGRHDVMPSGDFGVRKGFAIIYGDGETLPTPTALEKHAERWRPYRSVGSWFMWRAVEMHRANTEPKIKKTPIASAGAKLKPTGKSVSKTKSKPASKAKVVSNTKAKAAPKEPTKPATKKTRRK